MSCFQFSHWVFKDFYSFLMVRIWNMNSNVVVKWCFVSFQLMHVMQMLSGHLQPYLNVVVVLFFFVVFFINLSLLCLYQFRKTSYWHISSKCKHLLQFFIFVIFYFSQNKNKKSLNINCKGTSICIRNKGHSFIKLKTVENHCV